MGYCLHPLLLYRRIKAVAAGIHTVYLLSKIGKQTADEDIMIMLLFTKCLIYDNIMFDIV